MAAFDFPSSPTVGQTYTANGVTYKWDGVAWVGGPVVDTGAFVPMASYQKYAALAAQRNMIYNGGFQISQINAFTVATSGEPGDGWIIGASPANTNAQISYMNAASVPLQRGAYRCILKCTTAKGSLAAGDYWQLSHYVEGIDMVPLRWGSPNGVPALLRFGFRGPAGTYGVNIYNAPTANMSYVASFTITAGQANTDTIQLLRIPAPANGTTWGVGNQSAAMAVCFGFAAGTTYTGAGNTWAATAYVMPTGGFNGFSSTSNEFHLFDVNMVADVDNLNVDPGFVPTLYANELARCQRYYQMGLLFQAAGYAGAGTGMQFPVSWPVTMRIAPAKALRTTGTPSNCSGVDLAATNQSGGVLLFTTTATGVTAAYSYVWDLDARMP